MMLTENYGASRHYVGSKGEQYFEYQRQHAVTGGRIHADLFRPFIQAGDVVVDFGAGTGALLAHLPGSDKRAIELNPAARAFCASTFQIQAVAESAELPSDFADVVVSNHCLEHVPYPIAAMREVHRILKPGGLFVLCLPLDDWRTQRKYDAADVNHHLHTWTPLLLGHTLAEAGFHDPDIRVLTHAWPPGFAALHARLPKALFDCVCWSFALLKKRRQLFAVVRKTEK